MLKLVSKDGDQRTHGVGVLVGFWGPISLGVIFMVLFFFAGYILSFNKNSLHPVDLVVVLGGDSARYPTGKQLISSGLSPNLLLINQGDFESADASGLIGVRVLIDNLPRSSWQEAQAVRAWMEAYGWKTVLVVSDPPHMLRLRYTWFSVFGSADLSFSLVATNPDWWSALTWWSNPRSVSFVRSEFMKLGYYVLNYRFGIF